MIFFKTKTHFASLNNIRIGIYKRFSIRHSDTHRNTHNIYNILSISYAFLHFCTSAMDKSESYKVEKIIKKRIRKGRAEFYIKKKGFDERHNRWLCELLECDTLLLEFEKNYLQIKDKSNRKIVGATNTNVRLY